VPADATSHFRCECAPHLVSPKAMYCARESEPAYLHASLCFVSDHVQRRFLLRGELRSGFPCLTLFLLKCMHMKMCIPCYFIEVRHAVMRCTQISMLTSPLTFQVSAKDSATLGRFHHYAAAQRRVTSSCHPGGVDALGAYTVRMRSL
jgi:hypothetical protein